MDKFGIGETESMPTKFIVNIPGICHTSTVAQSNAQALSYALHQAFLTRNRFFFESVMYEGEDGLAGLIEKLLQDPRTMVDFVQALPGMASKPISIQLPMAQPPQAPPNPALQSPASQSSMAQASFHRKGGAVFEVIPVYTDDFQRVGSWKVRDEFNRITGSYSSREEAVNKMASIVESKSGWLKK